MKQAVNL